MSEQKGQSLAEFNLNLGMQSAVSHLAASRENRLKLRIIEQSWADQKFAVQEDVGDYGGQWVTIKDFTDEGSARAFAQLYLAGPRVIVELPLRGGEQVREADQVGSNALQGSGDVL